MKRLSVPKVVTGAGLAWVRSACCLQVGPESGDKRYAGANDWSKEPNTRSALIPRATRAWTWHRRRIATPCHFHFQLNRWR